MAHVEGKEILELTQAEVWELLNDPDTLGASIPGCRGFERDGDQEHRYRTAITVAIGAVKGVYEGTVSYVDVEEPERCTIVVAGRGDKGTIDGRGAIELVVHDEGTEVGYIGDFKLTGPVAGIAQRLAPGISRKMIVETLRNLERRGRGEPEPAAAEPAAPAGNGATATAAKAPAPPAQAPPPATAEAFTPFDPSPWAKFAAGLLIGVLIGRILFRRGS